MTTLMRMVWAMPQVFNLTLDDWKICPPSCVLRTLGRHAVPPLKLPSEDGAKDEAQGKGTAGSESETATEVSADDAKL